MSGGDGNDTYIVGSARDIVTENSSEGTDLIKSYVSFTASSNVENLTLAGSSNIHGTGNILDNTLTGNSGNNFLRGAGGADTINGGAGADVIFGNDGNDLINGGAGDDDMRGGTGDDTYIVSSAGDIVREGSKEGTDLVQSYITYALRSNVENLTLAGSSNIHGTGNILDNTLIGNSGNNFLRGAGGADTINGGAGADLSLIHI